jgi:ATP-dependent exoDNAse (exonuclease V) alpha subunit
MVTEEYLQYIQSAVKGRNVAVVFIGDVGQINPIRKPKSGVPLDAESPIFTNPGDIPVFELTERIRQGEDSPVLAFADMYYDFNTKKTQIVPDSRSVTSSTDGRLIISNMSEINFVDQLKELFFEAKETLNPNKIKIVAGTNLTVDKYNRMIQKLTNPQVTDDSLIRFGVGDMIMFNSNIYNSDGQTIVENADEGQIVSVDPTIHTDPETNIKYYTVVAKTLYNDIKLLIPINTRENNNTYIEVYNSLHDLAASNEFDQELLNDFKRKFGVKIDRGAVRPVIGLSYAITSDKSQGSTYEVVAVDVDDISTVTA